MKFLIVLIYSVFISSQSLDLNEVRTAYKEAAQDQTKVDKLYQSLLEVTKKDEIEFVAYKGAVMALKAKQAETIKDKKEGFVEGVTLVEYAIEKAPNDIEIRFIRLGIQENTPKILKYKGNIEEDKRFITKQIKYVKSSALRNHIKDYISQSKTFTAEEKSVILDL
jgi:hypothetical protein